MKFLFAALVVGFFLSTPQARAAGVAFHFYGAYDCPPCMAFKNRHLDGVEAAAKTHGFSVQVNVINTTRDVPKPGSFGDADGVLRAAKPELGRIYPPIFIVTRGDQIVMAKRSDWRAALETAVRQSGR